MKNTILLSFFILVCFFAKATTYYISANGNDGDGKSPATAWKTISKLNANWSLVKAGDFVLFNRGESFAGTVLPTVSGTSTLPVVIGAYGTGAKPVIKSLTKLTGWVSKGSGIWTSATNNSLLSTVKIVFLNGQPQAIGRYPNLNTTNKGYIKVTRSDTEHISSTALPTSPDWTGARVAIRSKNWVIDTKTVLDQTAYSGGGSTITVAQTSYNPGAGFGIFFLNDIKTLDQFSEWAYHPTAATVKLMDGTSVSVPDKSISMYFGTNNPNNYDIEASNAEACLSLNVSGQKYVTIQDLAFYGANTDAIFFSGNKSFIRIINCDINGVGANAVKAGGKDAAGHSITSINDCSVWNTNINNCGNNGIEFYGLRDSSYNNYVDSTYSVAGMGGSGDGQGEGIFHKGSFHRIKFNTVKHSGYVGINISIYSGAGDYNVVENNWVDSFAIVKDDGGGIYTFNAAGSNPQICTGNIIQGNIVTNGIGVAEGTTSPGSSAEGIYLDGISQGFSLLNNTIANCTDHGIFHNATRKIISRFNTFYNVKNSVYFRSYVNTTSTTGALDKSNVFAQNMCFNTSTGSMHVDFLHRYDDAGNWGTLDSNYYCRPLNEPNNVATKAGGIIIEMTEPSTGGYTGYVSHWYSLDTFQRKYKQYDQHSKKTQVTVSSINDVRFEFNPTQSNKTISLPFIYTTPDGKETFAKGQIILAPYTSKILIKTGTISGNQYPTVSLTAPTASQQYTAPATVTLSATAKDDGSVAKVEFYSGSTLLNKDTVSPYTYSWKNVAAGTYNLVAKATDNLGLATSSDSVSITVNKQQAPSVSVTSPANNATFTAPATINITADAADADGTVSKVQFYRDSVLLATDTSSPYAYSWTKVAIGKYLITAKATDNSGLATTSAAISVTVDSGNASPSVSISSPADGAQFYSSDTVKITASASDADGTIKSVQFYSGSTLLSTDTVSPYSYAWIKPAKGNYNLTAKATDNLGATKVSTVIGISVVDPPSYPKVALTSPANNATFNAPASITLTATATDVDGIATVKFYKNDTTLIFTETTSPYSRSWTSVPAGTYSITAVATDSTGLQTTSAARTITVNPVSASVGKVTGELKKWHKTTVTFDGPTASETDANNPFLNFRLNVTFKHSSGKIYTVPGYFAADGNALNTSATSGNKWRVQFSPDETGTWTYTASFRTGVNIAISDTVSTGTPITSIDGATGSFVIAANDKTGVDLRAKGRLNYVGSHLLQWAETKTYWRKTGTDAPENLLAYADIDNVSNYGSYRKTYLPHVADWKAGDSVWQTSKGKGLIGAINYLSSVGENSISFLTMNIRGDDRNVWPYIDTASRTRMDVSKLDQWGIIFDHAEAKGMHLHFKTQEVESWPVLGGDMTDQRKLYYRELIARFGYHLALNWNLGEENTQTTQQQKDMAQYFYDHDPYHSPIVLHSYPTEQELRYRPLLGTASQLTGVSIQKDTVNGYAEVRKWVEASAAIGKKWVVAWDEQGAAASGVAADANYTGNRGTVADNSDQIRRTVLWGSFMAGGDGVEYYYGYNTGETDLTLQDFRSRAKSYGYAKIAREFFDNNFPTTELKPLSNVSSTSAWSLGRDSFTYVVYLKKGGTTNITMPKGTYSVQWFNPRSGGAMANGSVATIVSTGTAKSIGNPPNNTTLDWVSLIQKVDTTKPAPTVTLTSPANGSLYNVGDTIVLTATASGGNPIVSVKFYSGTTLLFTETTAPYTRNWTGVAAGVYNVYATATDNAGKTTTTSPVAVITVKNNTPNKAPKVTLTKPVNNSQYVAPAKIDIAATATDSDGVVKAVTFYSGSKALFTDSTSPYTYTWDSVSAGNYNITAKAIDDSGKTASSGASAITVGNTPVPPSVSLTSPINGATFTAPATITLTADATDGDGTIKSVKFYRDSTLLFTDTVSLYTQRWTNVPVGSYDLTAVATDNSGLSTTSGKINVTVKRPANKPPTVSITSPADKSKYIALASVTINASAADADGIVKKVQFYQGSTLLATDSVSPYSYTWSNIDTGSYNITAKATDDSGAVTLSSPVNIIVSPKPLQPSVSLTSPTNNSIFTAPASISLAATATDADGTVKKVEFYNNGVTLIATDSVSPYAFSWTKVPAGSYSLTAKATDNDGLTSTSAQISVTVNAPANKPPVATITSPADSSVFGQPVNITIRATATDSDGTIKKVDFYNGQTLLGTDISSPYSYTWNSVAAGTYSITAVATDDSSATTTTKAVRVIVKAPNVKPSVSITAPVNLAQFITPTTITLTADASDADGIINYVKFYRGGTTLIATDSTVPYSYSWTNVAAGSYSITAQAQDDSGAVTTSRAVNISVRTVVAPNVSIASPTKDTSYLAPANVSVAVNASDPDGVVKKVELYRDTILVGTDTTRPYNFAISKLPVGQYALTAKAYDDDNLTTTSSAIIVTVKKPVIPPSVSITSPPQDATIADPAEVVITADAADADGSIIRVDFYRDSTLIGTSFNSPYSVTWSSVTKGDYKITARAMDNDSLVTTSAPVTLHITHVNVTPTIRIIQPSSNDTVYYVGQGTVLSAVATDNDGSVVKVEYYANDVLIGTVTSAPYSFSWDNIPVGVYQVTAKAYDNDGGITVSQPITITSTDNPIPIWGHEIHIVF